jgi:ubiquinone/menaquinone biosynthesis C-methylase UbiE
MKHYNFDRVASTYDSSRKVPEELSVIFRMEIENYLEENFEEEIYQILSLGLGSGRIEHQLSKEHMQLFGVDISKLMLEQFKKKKETYLSFISIADASSLPFRGEFHLTIAIHVIHLIKRFQELANEIKRISKAFVAGGVYTDLYSHPIYESYLTCLQNLGWNQESRGLSVVEFMENLQTEGYTIEERATSLPSYQISSEIYESIKDRCPSSLWNVPDSFHNRAIILLDEKIKNKEICFEEKYDALSHMRLYFVSFNK